MCDTVHFLSLEHAMKYVGAGGFVAPYCGEEKKEIMMCICIVV